MLAQRKAYHPRRLRIGNALADRRLDRCMECAIGVSRKLAHHLVEIECPGKVAHGQHQREAEPFLPQRARDIGCADLLGGAQRSLAIAACHEFRQLGAAFQCAGKERRVIAGAVERRSPVGSHRLSLCRKAARMRKLALAAPC